MGCYSNKSIIILKIWPLLVSVLHSP